MKNVALIGKTGSGKSHAAKYLAVNHDYYIVSFAKPVKELLAHIFHMYHGMSLDKVFVLLEKEKEKHFAAFMADDISMERAVYRAVEATMPEYIEYSKQLTHIIMEDKVRSPRTLCQRIGTEWGRDIIDVDIWVKKFKEGLTDKPKGAKFVCDDIRFPNECEFLHKKKNTVVLQVVTSRPDTTKHVNHDSESFYDELNFHHQVENEFNEKYIEQVLVHAKEKGTKK